MEAVMSPPPPSINGENLNPAELKEIILKTDHPFVIRNCIASWGAIKWSLAEFTELFGRIETRFKLHRKKTKVNTFCDGEPPNKAQRLVLDTEDKVPMETECVYQNGTFADFWDWLHGNNKNTLLDYPRYEDYALYLKRLIGIPICIANHCTSIKRKMCLFHQLEFCKTDFIPFKLQFYTFILISKIWK